MTIKCNASALHAGLLMLQIHNNNIQYLLILHGLNGYANATKFQVICKLPSSFHTSFYLEEGGRISPRNCYYQVERDLISECIYLQNFHLPSTDRSV